MFNQCEISNLKFHIFNLKYTLPPMPNRSTASTINIPVIYLSVTGPAFSIRRELSTVYPQRATRHES